MLTSNSFFSLFLWILCNGGLHWGDKQLYQKYEDVDLLDLFEWTVSVDNFTFHDKQFVDGKQLSNSPIIKPGNNLWKYLVRVQLASYWKSFRTTCIVLKIIHSNLHRTKNYSEQLWSILTFINKYIMKEVVKATDTFSVCSFNRRG